MENSRSSFLRMQWSILCPTITKAMRIQDIEKSQDGNLYIVDKRTAWTV